MRESDPVLEYDASQNAVTHCSSYYWIMRMIQVSKVGYLQDAVMASTQTSPHTFSDTEISCKEIAEANNYSLSIICCNSQPFVNQYFLLIYFTTLLYFILKKSLPEGRAQCTTTTFWQNVSSQHYFQDSCEKTKTIITRVS